MRVCACVWVLPPDAAAILSLLQQKLIIIETVVAQYPFCPKINESAVELMIAYIGELQRMKGNSPEYQRTNFCCARTLATFEGCFKRK